ncbi:VWA domain-containing protein [Alloacidobacterium dinghuense]|uniref:VWA domain-containing protein n=1 Tax=Alloacidobacterium dinghuense TaxID=2763107 RepID=A0A7G8BIC4_9BACT|nr:VWA domain-containing protein [Alloacidobacterium dinghuense]QNI32294.1 VWA domain-containing protein [Alloacidobacterium dinghuense]
MRLCNKRHIFFFFLLVASSFAIWAQAPASSQSSKPEQQTPLTVDRDPIVSPDAADNQPVSPSNPNAVRPGTDLEKEKGGFTFRRDVDEVVLNATVLDDNGRIVNDLKQDNFHVFEDGVQQTIAAFQHQDIPVSMGFLIDNSGSMRDKRAAVNTAALDLVKASNPQDEAFIVNFSDEAFIDQDFTSNIAKLRDGLAHIDSKGGTALYDAVVASADQLAKGAKRPKQVLLIITDGEDNASSLNLEQTIRRVQDLQGPVVYSIGLLFGDEGGGREAHRAKRALQLLSNETGGIAYFPKSLENVDQICAEVAHDIRNQYTIGYHSTKPASQGGYRVVKVQAAAPGHGKLVVRTRSGYYPKTDKSNPAENTAQRKAPAK